MYEWVSGQRHGFFVWSGIFMIILNEVGKVTSLRKFISTTNDWE